jgi:hypothetical protein
MADVSVPPLTTRACARYLGFSANWIRTAIDAGIVVGDSRVRLEAETVTVGRRRQHRIHLDKFIEFLRAINWKRLPDWELARGE